MITVLMLDLGDTLVKNNKVLPFVPQALKAFKSFYSDAGAPLDVCLVSDYFVAVPRTTERIDAIFRDYIALLDGFGLTEFFRPIEQRITLSTHAAVRKPDKKVFQLAIERLRLKVSLENCLFITENATHISACRNLGMKTLHFGPKTDSNDSDFSDWSVAPRLVASLLGSRSEENRRAIIEADVMTAHNIADVSIVSPLSSKILEATGQVLRSVNSSELGRWDGVFVYLPIKLEIELDVQGNVNSVTPSDISELDLQEAVYHVKSLIESGSVAEAQDDVGKTHLIESKGEKKILKRIGFQ